MSAPKVDVITVRWDAKTAMYRVDRPNWGGGKVVMYDAVAELIEASAEYRRGTECHVRECVHCHDRSMRMDAALARIGAQS